MLTVIATGGTGGHLFPALAVANALRRSASSDEVLFICGTSELELRLIGGAGFEARSIGFVPIVGKGVKGILKFLVVFPGAALRTVLLYRKRRPRLVIGYGGYPSFVPVLIGWLMRIPVVIHELNATAGLANRVLAPLAQIVFAVPGCTRLRASRIHYVRNPVREEFRQILPWRDPTTENPLTLLILGGSQGATRLNDAILELADYFRTCAAHVIHQTGARDYSRVRAKYDEGRVSNVEVYDFINNMPDVFSRAHLVISRAGAMTVAEVAASGRPAVFVPLDLAEAHQEKNVAELVSRGQALIVRQVPDLGVKLREQLERILGEGNQLQKMAKVADAYRASAISSVEQIVARLQSI